LLVPEKNAAALTDAIERLLGDAALRRHLGERGRETVLRLFDRSRNIRELAAVFSDRLHDAPATARGEHYAAGHVLS
jgi:glycosyltransferase involved in cell wall biosynthesis